MGLNRKYKLKLYKIILKQTMIYGYEVWTLVKSGERMLNVRERKILGRIFGTIIDNSVSRVRRNELSDL